MTPILQQFLSESRDSLQSISQDLLRMEKVPGDTAVMSDLFRSVHTLKGNSGLFDFPEMSRVLHAAEDLMSVVRDGRLRFSRELADRLLDAMDFVSMLLDRIEAGASSGAAHAPASVTLADSLRRMIVDSDGLKGHDGVADAKPAPLIGADPAAVTLPLDAVPPAEQAAWYEAACRGVPLHWVIYVPESDCFFKGEDPFFQARQTPEVVWRRINARGPWPPLAELDPYQCALRFELVSAAPRAALDEHYRYIPEQVTIVPLTQQILKPGIGTAATAGVAHAPTSGVASESIAAAILAAQVIALELPDAVAWLPGRLRAIASTLAACYCCSGREALLPALATALAMALSSSSAAPLREWVLAHGGASAPAAGASKTPIATAAATQASTPQPGAAPEAGTPQPEAAVKVGTPEAGAVTQAGTTEPEAAAKVGTPEPGAAASLNMRNMPFGRRADDARAVLKVDQEKIDRLMSLIGEMVVAKNGLPFLASRAETVYGVRDLSREIKTQYSVINRIAEEMQDAIMQVRMMPVSGVFQRFPRLVRDISHKLGKQVLLTLEGEETEADKNIIEALAEPLIHILRNSLDHGIETPEVRRAAGKPAEGRLVIRASQDSGRVLIDIIDDGKGIDPAVIKRKAYEKGLIDESLLERISDQDAINLVFVAGFSTSDVVSDLSGRGVGMDVVRNAVERVNGSVKLTSVPGKGTTLRLSLPLSMAVTNVMVIESNKQIFGVPMEIVIETVRVPRADIRSIKNRQTIVLRNRILPLRSLNEMLAADSPQVSNDQDEMATLVVQIHGESMGIVVDDFREVVDIILKPMGGILGGMPGYSGSALLGDGSVLMVLNPKELVTWH
jgi:two-component system chemotaxis sensor kinase CheA